MQKMSQQNDALLLPYLRAEENAESETLLSQLIAEHAEPIIRNVIRSTLRVSLASKDGSYRNQNALEIAGDVCALLIAEVSTLKSNTGGKIIGNFRSYVAVTTYHACYEYLRREHPQRAQLKEKIRYLLTHQPAFALWGGEDKEWLCGFGLWQGRREGASPRPGDALRQLRDSPQALTEAGLLRGGPHDAPLAALLTAIFKWSGGPVYFNDLITTVARLRRLDAQSSTHASAEEQFDGRQEQQPDPRADVAAELEQRLYLQKLWAEIGQLPLPQRAALLLNLRDAQGRDCIRLFQLTGTATLRHVAAALHVSAEELAELWNDLPLDDATIARRLGLTRQQVINLRKSARKRLARRMRGL
jgi:hypothetical protein